MNEIKNRDNDKTEINLYTDGMQKDLHALGNYLAQIKYGTLIISQKHTGDDDKDSVIQELNSAIEEAEILFRSITTRLREED